MIKWIVSAALRFSRLVVAAAIGILGVCLYQLHNAAVAAQSPNYGVGRPPTPDEIRGVSAAVAPDGTGLPEGSGTPAAEREVFAEMCARCHGEKAEGGVGPVLVGGQGTLATAKPHCLPWEYQQRRLRCRLLDKDAAGALDAWAELCQSEPESAVLECGGVTRPWK